MLPTKPLLIAIDFRAVPVLRSVSWEQPQRAMWARFRQSVELVGTGPAGYR